MFGLVDNIFYTEKWLTYLFMGDTLYSIYYMKGVWVA